MLLGRFFLGRLSAKRWGDIQKKKFLINKSAEDLIPFKEEHAHTYMYLNDVGEGFSEHIEILFTFCRKFGGF